MNTAMLTLVAAGIGLSACGSDSGSGGDVDAFCQILRDADAADEEVDLSEDPEAALEEFREFRDAAPSELRDDIDVFIDTFEQFEALEASGDDEEAFGAALALMFDPKFIAASENLESFGVEQCGLEPSSDDGFSFDDDGDGDGDGSEDAAPPVDGLITQAANVSDPLYDPFFDGDLDPTEISFEGAQYFLDVNYPDAPWRTRLGSWSYSGADPLDFGVGGTDISESEAQEVCGAIVEYLTPFGQDGEISVGSYTQNDDGTFGDESEVLSGTIADGC